MKTNKCRGGLLNYVGTIRPSIAIAETGLTKNEGIERLNPEEIVISLGDAPKISNVEIEKISELINERLRGKK